MTLLDAPKYNARRATIIRNTLLTLVIAAVVCAISSWFLWDWPEEHRVNRFMTAIEQKNYDEAFGIWNNDEAWKQHIDKYKDYPYERFLDDWSPTGRGNEFGPITSHKVVVSKTVGNGVVVGVSINGRPKNIFLRVAHKTHELGFSPVELYVGP